MSHFPTTLISMLRISFDFNVLFLQLLNFHYCSLTWMYETEQISKHWKEGKSLPETSPGPDFVDLCPFNKTSRQHSLKLLSCSVSLACTFQMSPENSMRDRIHSSSSLLMFLIMLSKQQKNVHNLWQRNKVPTSRSGDEILKMQCL